MLFRKFCQGVWAQIQLFRWLSIKSAVRKKEDLVVWKIDLQLGVCDTSWEGIVIDDSKSIKPEIEALKGWQFFKSVRTHVRDFVVGEVDGNQVIIMTKSIVRDWSELIVMQV